MEAINRLQFAVCIHCPTFNQKEFIRDALNGFCNQDTTFPFVCVIIDDASTDGEGELIKEYVSEHFDIKNGDGFNPVTTEDYYFTFAQNKKNKNCFFAVYLLRHNHYQLRQSKAGYYQEWNKRSKYIAICEGDDYWISPDKLERQVSFLDEHNDYSMTCNRTLLYSVRKQKMIGENFCYSHSGNISIKDTVNRTGLFISTCSILYRKEISENRPEYWRKCRIGDFPLQIACVLNGRAWYFNEAMSVYRVDNPSSWMGAHKWGSGTDSFVFNLIDTSLNMFEGFANDFPRYAKLLKNKKAEEINRNIPSTRVSSQEMRAFLAHYENEIDKYTLRWKIDLFFRKCRIPYVRIIYERLFAQRYQPKNKWYR